MYKYNCEFTGRLLGAIGIMQRFHKTITSNKKLTDKEINLKLYKTHDHIVFLKINGEKANN